MCIVSRVLVIGCGKVSLFKLDQSDCIILYLMIPLYISSVLKASATLKICLKYQKYFSEISKFVNILKEFWFITLVYLYVYMGKPRMIDGSSAWKFKFKYSSKMVQIASPTFYIMTISYLCCSKISWEKISMMVWNMQKKYFV